MPTTKKPTQPGRERPTLLTREQILDAEFPAALARLNRIARRHREGAPQDQADMDALAESLVQIVSGIKPKLALGIQGRKGQGRKPMTGAECDLWFSCVYRVEELRHSGLLREPALAQVVAERHVSSDSLIRWHKRYRKSAIGVLMFVRDVQRVDAERKRFLGELEHRGVKKRADS